MSGSLGGDLKNTIVWIARYYCDTIRYDILVFVDSFQRDDDNNTVLF